MISDERLDALIEYLAYLCHANAAAGRVQPPFQAIPLVADPAEALEILLELKRSRFRAEADKPMGGVPVPC
jgi:hypothetical protein